MVESSFAKSLFSSSDEFVQMGIFSRRRVCGYRILILLSRWSLVLGPSGYVRQIRSHHFRKLTNDWSQRSRKSRIESNKSA